MAKERLQKYLAECGVASRRRCEELIAQGKVFVNGKVATLGMTIDPGLDVVMLNHEKVEPEKKLYILLNKPRGVVTSVKDPHHKKTVMNYLNGVSGRVFPVGRLDIDVEGALLMTNDGELAYRLTHPKYEVPKVYLAWVRGKMPVEMAVRMEKGVKLDDGISRASRVVVLNQGNTSTLIEITMREGRKREIKRMCARIGHEVLELKRISIGNLQVGNLQPGEWRFLKDAEIQELRRLVAL